MELIRKLPARKDRNGKWQSYAVFLCPFCLKEVEMRLSAGKICQSCGCKTQELKSKTMSGENHPLFGKHHSEETRMKQSNTKKYNYANGKKSPMKGKQQSEEAKQKIREGRIGKYEGINSPMYGKKHAEESKNIISEKNKGKLSGEKNPMYGKSGILSPVWNNGSSFEPYGIEFNKPLKQSILERDSYTCQNPNCEHLSKGLDAHHIDYNKKNNDPKNIITLCDSCHTKTNGKNNRQYWTEFYQKVMEDIKNARG